jgi:hypothetical protein
LLCELPLPCSDSWGEIWASGQEKGRELLETREEQQLPKRQEMVAVNVPLSTAGAK